MDICATCDVPLNAPSSPALTTIFRQDLCASHGTVYAGVNVSHSVCGRGTIINGIGEKFIN
eukprot:1322423-Amorphochlora_amoeboformis.AAC.2